MLYFWDKIFPVLIDKLAIGFFILIAGLFVNRFLEKYKLEQNKILAKFQGEQNRVLEELKGEQSIRKEYEVLRDKTALQHLQRQIEELYSPLLGLIEYSTAVYRIASQRLPSISNWRDVKHSKEEVEIWLYFEEKYFLPLNSEIATLLRTKIYLLDSDELPESFNQFLQHESQYSILHKLWKDKDINSKDIAGKGWPTNFERDVKDSLTRLRQKYNEYIKRFESAAT